MPQTYIRNARVIDGTGADPFTADVIVDENRISKIVKDGSFSPQPGSTVVDAGGATLMPGLIEAHAHPSFTGATALDGMGIIPPEEHTLITARQTRLLFDQGFTSLCCAASAKARLDLVVRNAINAGEMVGPRMLVASPEMTVTGGVGDVRLSHLDRHSVEVICDGPDEFRKTSRWYAREGVDTLKIDISGDEFVPFAKMGMTTMNDDEVAAVVEVARSRKLRVAAHARNAESVKMCVRHGIELVYHADTCDSEALDLLEENKDKHFVVPAMGFVISTVYDAAEYGIGPEVVTALGMDVQLEAAVINMKELKSRGVRVLPGGDYGALAWNPLGTNARDLEHFVKFLDFSPMEAIVAATKLGGEIMMMDDLGCIQEGFLADLLIVDGDPLQDISILQNADNLLAIMKDGVLHKDETSRRVPASEPVLPGAVGGADEDLVKIDN
jgi:imidazolonepropionase-like amidohydrolase